MIRFEKLYRKIIRYGYLTRPEITISRGPSTDHGTRGLMIVDGQVFHTLELPWNNNKSDVSCIPTGSYDCIWHYSPRFGWVYKVLGVPGRTQILIHVGNWAGDVSKRYKSKTKGCILLGLIKGMDDHGQSTIWNSGKALKKFYKIMNKKPFKLIIKGNL